MSFSRAPLLFAATVAVLAGTACGTEAEPRTAGAEVATLQSAPAGSPAPAGSAAAVAGAVIRPDASSEEIRDLERVYFTCLRDNGAPSSKDGDARPGQPSPAPDKVRAANAACADKAPVSWFDVEQQTNPEFPDLLRATAECLNQKGFQARAVQDPGWKLAYRDSGELMRAGDTEADCINEAFAARIKTYR